MTKHPLTVALITTGVLAAGTAAALGLPKWLSTSTSASATQTQPQVMPADGAPGAAAVTVAKTSPPPVPMLSVAGQVPDYRAIAKLAGPAVVGVDGVRHARAFRSGTGHGRPPLLPRPAGRAAARTRRQPVGADARPGLGFHRQRRRPDPDQRPCGARRRGSHRQAERPPRVCRQGAGQRCHHRHRRCCASKPAACPPCAWATRVSWRSATRWWRIGAP